MVVMRGWSPSAIDYNMAFLENVMRDLFEEQTFSVDETAESNEEEIDTKMDRTLGTLDGALGMFTKKGTPNGVEGGDFGKDFHRNFIMGGKKMTQGTTDKNVEGTLERRKGDKGEREVCRYAIKKIGGFHLRKLQKAEMSREVDILKVLEHPNIVKVYKLYKHNCAYYMVLEYLTGGELFGRIIQKESYSEREARDVVKVLVDAVSHLHEKSIVHRDLNPGSILLANPEGDQGAATTSTTTSPPEGTSVSSTRTVIRDNMTTTTTTVVTTTKVVTTARPSSGSLKITDFDMARSVSEGPVKSAWAKNEFSAPEMLMREAHGPPVDMWSLGLITYILLSGYNPFFHEDEQQMFYRVMKGDCKLKPEVWGNISPDAKGFVERLLTVNAESRMTAQEAKNHAWLHAAGDSLGGGDLRGILEEFKISDAKRKLRALMKTMDIHVQIRAAKLLMIWDDLTYELNKAGGLERRRSIASTRSNIVFQPEVLEQQDCDKAEQLEKQGKYEEVEPMYRRLLAIHETIHGPDHPDVARDLNNWAGLMYKQGWYAEAETVFERSLAIREKVFGLEHSVVAQSHAIRARLSRKQGKNEAWNLRVRATEIKDKTLGPDRPTAVLDSRRVPLVMDHSAGFSGKQGIHDTDLLDEALFTFVLIVYKLNILVRQLSSCFWIHQALPYSARSTFDRGTTTRVARARSGKWPSPMPGAFAAACFWPEVAAAETLGERLEPTVSAFLRWLCHAPLVFHALVVTLVGASIYRIIVSSIRDIKAGNAKFSAAWREVVQAKKR